MSQLLLLSALWAPDVKIPPQIIPHLTPLPGLALFSVGMVLPQFAKGAGSGRWGPRQTGVQAGCFGGLCGEHFG